MRYTLLCLAALGASGAFAATLVSDYDFNGTLNPAYNNGHAGPMTLFNNGTGGTAIGGDPAYVDATVGTTNKQVATLLQSQALKVVHGLHSNGGGANVNLYTVLWDVNFTDLPVGYGAFYNTAYTNNNNGDLFLRSDGAIGTTGVYGGAGQFKLNTWNRVVLTADLTTAATPKALLTMYLNGTQVNTVTYGGRDGSWGIYGYDDSSHDGIAWLFGDNDNESANGYVSQVAFFDGAMTADEVAALGPVGSAVPEPATIAVLGLGMAFLAKRKRR